jgi:hypothetical protein
MAVKQLTEKQKIFCREYKVDRDGNIYSLRGRIMKLQKSNCGYLTVSISDLEKKRRLNVHRIVASAFVENPNNLPEVNHKDLNKLNNKASNLEWATRKGNMIHMFRNRPFTPPSRAKTLQIIKLNKSKRILSADKQSEIESLKGTVSQAEISRRLNVSPQTIMRYLKGGMYG